MTESEPILSGYDLPPLEVPRRAPLLYARRAQADLGSRDEVEMGQHFTRLASANALEDVIAHPLPSVLDEIAELAGFRNLHPDLPLELSQGALEVIFRLEALLCAATGMDACCAQTVEGSSRTTGLLIVRIWHERHASTRSLVLVPEDELCRHSSAIVAAGYQPVTVTRTAQGILSAEDVSAAIERNGREIAAFLFTNPSPRGLFESECLPIASLVHGIGAQVFLDGRRMNWLLGVAQPRDMGVDLMQWDLHSALETPQGSEGPSASPLLVRTPLVPHLPGPRICRNADKYVLEELPQSVGRVREGLGNFGILLRALASIYRQGSDGLKRLSRATALGTHLEMMRLGENFEHPAAKSGMGKVGSPGPGSEPDALDERSP